MIVAIIICWAYYTLFRDVSEPVGIALAIIVAGWIIYDRYYLCAP